MNLAVTDDPPRLYTREEVEAILARALEQDLAAKPGDLGHRELLEAAREVGIDEATLNRAVTHVDEAKQADEVRDAVMQENRQKWGQRMVTYTAVVGGFLALHLAGFVGGWVWWMAIIWGMSLMIDTYKKLTPPTEREIEREQKRRRKKRRRARRRETRAAEKRAQALAKREREARRRKAGEDFEKVVEGGVGYLLDAAARKIEEVQATRGDAPKGEFGRYVQGQQTGAGGARVRVDAEAAEDEEEELPGPGRARRRQRR